MRLLNPFVVAVTWIDRFIRWWLAELSEMIPARIRRLFAPRQKSAVLYIAGDRIHLRRWEGGRCRERLNETSGDIGGDLPTRLATYNRRGIELVLCLPREQGLAKEIKLPSLAPGELRRALFYQIDRQTPFPSADVFFDWTVIEESAGQVRLSLVVVPKKAVEQVSLRFAKQNIRFDRIALGNADDREPPRLNLRVGVEEPEGKSRFGGVLNTAMAAIICVFVIAIGQDALIERRAAAEAMSTRVAEARVAANRVANVEQEVSALRKNLTFFAERRRGRPTMLAVLLELTRIVPDHTWLNELQSRDDEVRLAGYSSAATDLIGIIDASEMFVEPRFRSPVTVDPSTGKERFNLTFRISGPAVGETQ